MAVLIVMMMMMMVVMVVMVMMVVIVVMVVVMVVMVVVMVDSIEVVGTQLSGGGRRESFEEIRANKDPQSFLRSLLRPFQSPLCGKTILSLLVWSDYSSPLNTFSHRLERR